METQLQESKRNETAAIAAQEALKVQMAELQASYESIQKAQADAAATSDLQAQHHSEEWAQKLAQQEQEWKCMHSSCYASKSRLTSRHRTQANSTSCSESLRS